MYRMKILYILKKSMVIERTGVRLRLILKLNEKIEQIGVFSCKTTNRKLGKRRHDITQDVKARIAMDKKAKKEAWETRLHRYGCVMVRSYVVRRMLGPQMEVKRSKGRAKRRWRN